MTTSANKRRRIKYLQIYILHFNSYFAIIFISMTIYSIHSDTSPTSTSQMPRFGNGYCTFRSQTSITGHNETILTSLFCPSLSAWSQYSERFNNNRLANESEERIQELVIQCDGSDDKYWASELSPPFKNDISDDIVNLSLHHCGGEAIRLGAGYPKIKFLNLSNNNFASVNWQTFLRFTDEKIQKVDLRRNHLSCQHCQNRWINLIDSKEGEYSTHTSTLRTAFAFPELPTTFYIDSNFDCKFDDCLPENSTFLPKIVNTSYGSSVELKCRFHTAQVIPMRKEWMDRIFIWPLQNQNSNESEPPNSKHSVSWDSSTNEATLSINSTDSNDLGFVICRCFHCAQPSFDIGELRFDTNLSVRHVTRQDQAQDNLGYFVQDSETDHLVLHGYPLDLIQITVYTNNISENHLFTDDKHATPRTSFFNDSLVIKYEKAHSHFFVKYFSVYLPHCYYPAKCVYHPHISDYLLEFCAINSTAGCVQQLVKLANIPWRVPVLNPTSSSYPSIELIALTLLIISASAGLVLVLLYTFCKTRRKFLLREKLRRRRVSRNSRRTEETSIPLETLSSHDLSSQFYATQVVPLINNNEIQLREKIGKGAFGECYLAIWTTENGAESRQVAVKMLYNVQMDAEMEKEAALLAKLDHPNVVKLFGISYWNNQLTLVLELMTQGDLKSFLRNRTPRCTGNCYSQFPPALLVSELLKISVQVAESLCYLCNQQVVHRDLAARNCLVNMDGSDMKLSDAALRPAITIKISDFGMSRNLYTSDYYKMQDKKAALPIRWLPPECINSGKFTHQSDIWSFGVVLYEIFSYGDVPYGNLNNNEVLTAVTSGLRPEVPDKCPQEITEVMKACWKINPMRRITIEEARLKLLNLNLLS